MVKKVNESVALNSYSKEKIEELVKRCDELINDIFSLEYNIEHDEESRVRKSDRIISQRLHKAFSLCNDALIQLDIVNDFPTK